MSALTDPFWAACREQRLVVPECSRCRVRFFVPETVCPGCWSADWSWVSSPGTGAIYSCTVVHRGLSPEVDTPYVLAAVELDDGWTMLSNIVGCPAELVHIGMRVRVTFAARTLAGTTLTVPVFLPAP